MENTNFMSDQINNAPMSTSERKLWLASHNAPPDMMLVTIAEMLAMRASMDQSGRLSNAFTEDFKLCVGQLGEYWQNEPSFVDAVASAAFDASRYKKASELALAALKCLKVKADGLCKASGVSAALAVDLLGLSKGLDEALEPLEKESNKRRERKPSKKAS